MKVRKRLFSMMLTALLLCVAGTTAAAAPAPDLARKGSIEITMRQGDQAVSGGTLTIYQTGTIEEDNGNYRYVLTESFRDSGKSLENLQSADLAANLAQYAADHDLNGAEQEIDSNGRTAFRDLEPGVYLIVQEKAADGYEKCDAFLVTVPGTEGGELIYDVDASPKVELKKTSGFGSSDSHSSGSHSSDSGSGGHSDAAAPAGTKLPQTGQMNWPVPILAGLGMCLFLTGWILCHGKRSRYEK